MNYKGQLGIGDKNNRLTPEENKFFKGKSIIHISGGFRHSIFLIEKMKFLCFIIQLKRKDFFDIKFKFY